jgi:hypothetical protein
MGNKRASITITGHPAACGMEIERTLVFNLIYINYIRKYLSTSKNNVLFISNLSDYLYY